MTALEVCPNCGGEFRAYEDPDTCTVSGTCYNCGRSWTFGLRKAAPEPEPVPYEYQPEPIRREMVHANTLVFIKDASAHEDAVASIRNYFTERGGVLDARNARRDRHYFLTGADMPAGEFNRWLDDMNIPGVGWTYPANEAILTREAGA